MEYRDITPYELENIIGMIGKDWMLITATDGTRVNTMTASWGMMGVLWDKAVCTLFIRPQRYTAELTEASERMSLSFFGKGYRDALKLCGTVSGRDGDKFARADLTVCEIDGVPAIAEASVTVICRKLYADILREDAFVDRGMLAHYAKGDYHRVYVCEIERILVK